MRIEISFNAGNYSSVKVGEDFNSSTTPEEAGQYLRSVYERVAIGAGLMTAPAQSKSDGVPAPIKTAQMANAAASEAAKAKAVKEVEKAIKEAGIPIKEEVKKDAPIPTETTSPSEPTEEEVAASMTMDQIRAAYGVPGQTQEERQRWQRIYNLKKGATK